MGYNFLQKTAPWTFILCIIRIISLVSANLFQDLGLGTLPDITKINVSQDEYSHMMEVYLSTRRLSHGSNVPYLVTFDVGAYQGDLSSIKLQSPSNMSGELEVDTGELKLLFSPMSRNEPEIVQVRLYEIFGPKQRRFVNEKTLYLKHNQTKWCEFDITDSVQWWLNDKINSKFELICVNCVNKSTKLNVRKAFVNALILKEGGRSKRSSYYDRTRRTDCRYTNSNRQKMKCCRHNMTVTFNDLRFPEMASIIQPKNYEAGYCQGRCPPNYNYATNHSRIQTLVHQMDKKLAKQLSRKAIPKACCSPSKLEPLEIIRVDPYNNAKLIVEKWENMQVTECACS